MKILFYSSQDYEAESIKKNNNDVHTVTPITESLHSSTVTEASGYDAISLFVNDIVDTAIAKQLSEQGVKLVLLRCAGFDKINLEALATGNIKVMRVPIYSPHAVAEHALGLILSLSRKTHKSYSRIQNHNFDINGLTGFNLHGKTIGVIGTGNIGTIFSKIMLSFGCNVIAYDIFESDEVKKLGVQYVSLETLFQESDIISLHCPLFDSTKHMVNAGSINTMKDGVMIINTSRGALVKTDDILSGLQSGKVGYLGTDVYENESGIFFTDHSKEGINDPKLKELISHENVLLTSHQAFLTNEALDEIASVTFKNIHDFEKGNESNNYVS